MQLGRGLGVENVLSTLVYHDRYEILVKLKILWKLSNLTFIAFKLCIVIKVVKSVNLLFYISLKLCTGVKNNESCIVNHASVIMIIQIKL